MATQGSPSQGKVSVSPAEIRNVEMQRQRRRLLEMIVRKEAARRETVKRSG
ncbi:MAG: hypothetical protein KDA42_03885 [Planctomycetales bacterium]|nr:hypothetical protein [Planctomycetales bacterium]